MVLREPSASCADLCSDTATLHNAGPVRDDVYLQAVLQKCDALKRAGLWAGESKVRPLAWLNNFADNDKIAAAVLLDHFVYFSDPVTDRLLLATFRSLRDRSRRGLGGLPPDLVDTAVFTRVEGEKPNPTDSGNVFCRKARQVLAIPERRVLEPAEAVAAAARGTPVIFLDDFVGSGDQFCATWGRPYLPTSPRSFADVFSAQPFPAIYLCLITTQKGRDRIHVEIPSLVLDYAHLLAADDSVRSLPTSPLIPPLQDPQKAVADLLQQYSPRLSLPAYMGQDDWAQYGYQSLGTTIAFEHGVPDATVPLVWADGSNGWIPLARRS